MEHVLKAPRRDGARVLIGSLATGVIVLLVAFFSKHQSGTPGSVYVPAILAGLGTLGLAAWLAPITPYPRWAHWASAGIVALVPILSAAIASSPASWIADFRTQSWFLPWFVLMSSTTRGRDRGACATRGSRAGWLLVGSSFVYVGLFMLAGEIARRL